MKYLFRVLAVIPVLGLLVMAFTAPVAAADPRTGDTVVIASGDVVNDDLYIAANVITINGIVNGDVLCVGATININGRVNGSVIATWGDNKYRWRSHPCGASCCGQRECSRQDRW